MLEPNFVKHQDYRSLIFSYYSLVFLYIGQERSYKKKLQQVDPDKDNSRKVNETMNTVNALYQQILNDNDVDKMM